MALPFITIVELVELYIEILLEVYQTTFACPHTKENSGLPK